MKIAPSILSADFANLLRDIEMVKNAGAEYLHIDVMDGHFVPNLSFGPHVVKSLRPQTDMVLDVHLMISQPERYVEAFVKAGSDIITVHSEVEGCEKSIELILAGGKKAGVCIKPMTEPAAIEHLLPKLSLVLVMSVEPGFGGQVFMPDSLRKVRILKEMRERAGLDFEIEIDGGINAQNIGQAAQAGVDVSVAGSSVFEVSDPPSVIKAMLAV